VIIQLPIKTLLIILESKLKKESLSIKDWALDDRPREKLLQKGVSVLSDAELIAILIGSGNKEQSAVSLSKFILNEFKQDLNLLSKKSVNDLMQFKGIGEAKAISIIAALELGKRRISQKTEQQKTIRSSQDIYNLMQEKLRDLPHEEFWVLFLNRSNKIIDTLKLSQGGISATVIDKKLIFKKALELLASSLILCHNHPSGNKKPSYEDKRITQEIQKAAAFFELAILDHIIICGDNYYSFADDGIL